ncbi:MAG: 1-(5-phosphoribosyl)-5-[(5-phosphoribosylamino)methylideneamino]imidazole-4-carboxamide isomerase [Candidatus Omnitrophica bacterium]|nr:1-(5-phosphoribosyl)-5-[(5-phosphoribosylamino)methylideneamino]imidazole-4-carboxamide isomerase [Candidatus Omnitrophota bacterium]
MLIIPAIDIIEGRAVRLTQGDFKRVKVYPNSPLQYALRWQKQGARLLHIVDLDGAKTGRPKNFEVIKEIISKIDVPVEVGGGMRTESIISRYLKVGAEFVVVGTRVLIDKGFLERVISKYKDRIIVSADSKNNLIKISGWKKKTDINAINFIRELEQLKVKRIIFTDISRDGMLKGINVEAIKNIFLNTKDIKMVASGGISSYADILKLRSLKEERLFGAIVGKALYENKVSLKKAQNLCLQKE